MRNKKDDPQIYMELQVASNSLNNIDKDEYGQRIYTFWFPKVLKSYTNQSSVVLA